MCLCGLMTEMPLQYLIKAPILLSKEEAVMTKKIKNSQLMLLHDIAGDTESKYAFQLSHCLHLRVTKDWCFNHVNDDQHLLLVEDGAGEYRFFDETVKLSSGKLIFVSNGVMHSAAANSRNLPRIFPVRFSIVNVETGRPFKFEEPFYLVLDNGMNDVVYGLFKQLHHCHNNDYGETNRVLTGKVFQLIFAEMLRVHKLSQRGPHDVRIDRVVQYLEEHPLDMSRIDELAKRASLTTKYFSRKFREQTGLTPKAFQVRSRLRYARFLLEESRLSVKETAAAIGAADQYVFSRQFKKQFGISPVTLKN
jgi:AraC-like DNA-binding protein